MKVRMTAPYTVKIIEGKESGYAEVRLYPCRKSYTRRMRNSHKSLKSQQKANEKRSVDTFFIEAVENFYSNDFFITVTFAPEITDIRKRIDLFLLVIRWFQRKCYSAKKILKYIYCWGRGTEKNQLHAHVLLHCSDYYFLHDIIMKCYTFYWKKGVYIDIKHIDSYNHYDTDEDNIRYIVYYLVYNNWKLLTEEDRKLIKKMYYGSQTLNRFYITEKNDDDIDRDISESPSKLMNAIANAKDYQSIDAIVRRVFPGYRLERFHYNYGNSPVYIDDYGQFFSRLKLVKIGSRLDGRKYIYENCLKIDEDTGEVIEDFRPPFDV